MDRHMKNNSYNTTNSASIVNKIYQTISYLKLLAEENRVAIITTLLSDPHCVSEIQSLTKLSQSLVSHHLHDLKKASLVASERSGKWVYYSLTPRGQTVLFTIQSL